MSDLPDPLLSFRPILKERVWGGTALRDFGIQLPPNRVIGEAWLLADLPLSVEDGRSAIEGGAWSGRTLHELVRKRTIAVLGGARPMADGSFPLLVKLLDAHENLSVQVHPTAAYARSHPNAAVKNEAWVILRAEPEAVLYLGLREGTGRDEFLRRASDGTLTECLRRVPARVGDCYHVPSGTCHALGAGIVVAEVQTPSDTTFRIYDWGRTERTLHVEAAAECIFGPTETAATTRSMAPDPLPAAAPTPPAPQPRIVAEGLVTTRLVDTPDFTIERIEATESTELPMVTNGQPIVLLGVVGDAHAIAGSAALDDGSTRSLEPGRLAMVPACSRGCTVRLPPGAVILRVELPSPLDSMIA